MYNENVAVLDADDDLRKLSKILLICSRYEERIGKKCYMSKIGVKY